MSHPYSEAAGFTHRLTFEQNQVNTESHNTPFNSKMPSKTKYMIISCYYNAYDIIRLLLNSICLWLKEKQDGKMKHTWRYVDIVLFTKNQIKYIKKQDCVSIILCTVCCYKIQLSLNILLQTY